MRLEIMLDDGVEMPSYAHEGDAGLDLRVKRDVVLQPNESQLVGTGVRVAIPKGFVGLQFPRSGLGSKGITLRNAVGVIDSGYRGEVKAPLWNTTSEAVEIAAGDRVCQLVIVPYARCELMPAEEFEPTDRGEGGYGSTGVK